MKIKNFTKYSFLLVVMLVSISSCKDEDDEIQPVSNLEIQDFIWRGMNAFYLYKSAVPDLSNDRFTTVQDLNEYLADFEDPESLFNNLLRPGDDFSFITSDYVALEKLFDGISTSDGMDFQLRLYDRNSNSAYGYVRYVVPNSDADRKGVKRGMIFSAIDDTPITQDNFRELISRENYTITLAELEVEGTGDTRMASTTPTGEQISLTKTEFTENPILVEKILEVNGKKVGYLMYNSFVADFDEELNAVFGRFKAEGVVELVLDLRYNGGGSVSTAVNLASMITGQYSGELFSVQRWNADRQAEIDQSERLRAQQIRNFKTNLGRNDDEGNPTGTVINSLKLNRVFILALNTSASASELVINGLNPYSIDVQHIGLNTRGKYQASITLYDSDDYRREGASKSHRYAMQPLVLKSANKVNNSDYDNGLTPDVIQAEDEENLGELGDPSEPLLKVALDIIATGDKPASSGQKNSYAKETFLGENKMLNANYQRMYVDGL